MKIRMHECKCGHSFTAEVEYAEWTTNLSGEKTQWCPKCGKRPWFSSPIYTLGKSEVPNAKVLD